MNHHHPAGLFKPHLYPSRLTPASVRLALLLNGMDFPLRDPREPLRYLELGPGQGERCNIHAASLPEWEFWGVGGSPDDTLKARETATAAGLPVNIPEISIETLAREGLSGNFPSFDIIAIDSAWSRENEAYRQHLLAILHNHLKTGGIICIGYHAMPGCAPLVPLRDLMLCQTTAETANEARRFHALQALDFTDTYAETDSGFFAQMPAAKWYLESIKNSPFEQLEKNWLNPDWKPFYFSAISGYMESIRCRFAASLDLSSQLDMCLPAGIVPILHAEEDAVLRETIRDYGLNRQARLDLFARGIRYPDAGHIERQLAGMPFCLTMPLQAISAVTLPTPSGDLLFDEEIYTLFLQALSEDNYRPKTLQELQASPLLKKLDHTLFPAVINILAAAGLAFPAREAVTPESEKACMRLNRILCEYSREGKTQPALASPVLGSGIPLSRMWQLFLLACANGAATPDACAQAVLQMLATRKEQLLDSNGMPLDETETPVLLEAEARLFFENGLPYLAAMKVLPCPPYSD